MNIISTKEIIELFVDENVVNYGYDRYGDVVELPIQSVVIKLCTGESYRHAKFFEQQPDHAYALKQRIARSKTIDLSEWKKIH